MCHPQMLGMEWLVILCDLTFDRIEILEFSDKLFRGES